MRNRIIKQVLTRQFAGWSTGTVEKQRARQKKASRFIRLPADVSFQPVQANGVSAEWIDAPGEKSGVILYLHGGAYTLGATRAHRELASRLSRIARVRVLMLYYRLAPEFPFPAALQDVLSGYRWLLAQDITPGEIIFAGDSAGGGLALSALLSLRDAGQPLPAGAICISPWVDLALTSPSVQNKADADPILDGESLKTYAGNYAGDLELTTPLLSPLYSNMNGLPPLLIQVGSEEILLDDATRINDLALADGVPVTLKIWEEMFHVFHLLSFLPESKKAIGQIAEFVTANLFFPNQ